ncbi:MAG: NifB/NifX family molybdenum-iron cluster-binding protein [Staphylothermus sp.]|nr:NifB/NifX family molybdenum-iron cluster-binding protein [Staphylothermus sp.]
MKIAIATNKGGLYDQIADRFGRAPTFTIVELDDSTFEVKNVYVVENLGSKAGSGAGVRAVQKLVDEKVNIVIGPNPGPKAYIALQQSGIKIYPITGMSAREALNRILEEIKRE